MSPIRPQDRHRYPPHWRELRELVLERGGNCCAWCGARNGADIQRPRRDPMRWEPLDVQYADTDDFARTHTASTVVLTTAHLDGVVEHCGPDNLLALCQRCHLTLDAKQHAANARDTLDRRRGQTRLDF